MTDNSFFFIGFHITLLSILGAIGLTAWLYERKLEKEERQTLDRWMK